MLQSFLIIKDSVRPTRQPPQQPESALAELGLRTLVAPKGQEIRALLARTDAVVLYVPAGAVVQWVKKLNGWRPIPTLWWCDEALAMETDCSFDSELDGILFPQLSPAQLHWALLLGTNRFLQRTQWDKEREQLLARLEERKWIDRAKAILCEIKHISEAEAYDFLRKQAMNERKRMADVASSIVRVYELLREQNQGR